MRLILINLLINKILITWNPIGNPFLSIPIGMCVEGKPVIFANELYMQLFISKIIVCGKGAVRK